MSTILRGTTTADKSSSLNSTNFDIVIKEGKGDVVYFNISVSDRDFADFKGQAEDVIAFLKQYKEELERWKDTGNVDSWEIDFGFNPKILSVEYATENLTFPTELITLCAALSFQLNVTLYDFERNPSS